jgi:protein subunit release factor B
MQQPGFWDDQQRAASVSTEHRRATRKLESFRALEAEVEDLAGLAELAAEDESIGAELEEQLADVERRMGELEEERLFGGEYDAGDAAVTVHSGAGGTDSQARRHTAFAGVEVTPLVDEVGDVEIEDDDLQIDTYRASGAGGQHVNKTDSAVRITHKPTGIVVQCQNERSQSSNKQTAMKLLKSKLIELEERKRREELAREKGDSQDVNFGSQIRSYVLHPYTMVKDHRTNEEMGDVQRVLDGDLDRFIRAELERRAST